MAEDKELFPRSGAVVVDARKGKKENERKRKPSLDRLFTDNPKRGVRKDQGKKRPKVVRGPEDGRIAEESEFRKDKGDRAVFASTAHLTEGVQMLGVVKTIMRNFIEVSLPFNMTGYLPAEETLLDPETTAPTSLHEMPDAEEVGPRPLAGVLQERELVAVSIKSVEERSGKRRIALSMKMEQLNRGLDWCHLMKGFPLLGAVKSVEEHGYILSLGEHVDFTAFLRFEDVAEDEQQSTSEYHVGSLVRCTVAEDVPAGKRRRSIQVRLRPEEVAHAVTGIYDGIAFGNLRVGALVQATVTKGQTNGTVLVSVMSLFTGVVAVEHLPRDRDAVKAGAKMLARVIFVDSAAKSLYLSLKEEMTADWTPAGIPEEYTTGAIFEDAVVTRIIPKYGVMLKRGDGVDLFAHISRIADDRVDHIAKFAKVGRPKRCRVVGRSLMDGVVNVSLQESVLDQVAMSYGELQPGTVVDCTVLELQSAGCVVKVAGSMQGLIPPEHFADVKLVRRAKDKFVPGSVVKCITLSVDAKRRRIKLSAKRSLLKAADLIPRSFEEAAQRVGDTCVGFVVGRTPSLGVLVGFFGDAKGYLSPSEIGLKAVKSMSALEAHFPSGHTLKTRIVSCDPSRRRIQLSMKDGPSGDTDESMRLGLQVGDVISGVVKEAADSALTVKVVDGDTAASVECVLPLEHLADSRDLAQRCFEAYTPDVSGVPPPPAPRIEDMLVLKTSTGGHMPLLTAKPSLLAAWRAKSLPESLEEMEAVKNKLLTGYVVAVLPTGAVVGFAGAQTGFVRKSRISDAFVADPVEYFHVGQTVQVCIDSIDRDSRKVALSARRSDLSEREAGPPPPQRSRVRLFCDALHRIQRVERNVRRGKKLDAGAVQLLSSLQVGSVIRGVVGSRTTSGVVLQLTPGDAGTGIVVFAVQAQVGTADVTEGRELDMVVLDMDHGKGIVDVSLKEELIDANRSRERKRPGIGKSVHCVVELVKDDLVIVSLPRRGHLIAHSLSRAVNESQQRPSRLRPGMRFKAQTLGPTDDGPLLVELAFETSSQSSPAESRLQSAADLSLGLEVSGEVKSSFPNQVNVAFGKAGVGRIHVTEAMDAPAELDGLQRTPTAPLLSIAVGSQIAARVVLVRNEEPHVVELSLRRESPTEDPDRLWERLQPGAAVMTFVQNARNDALWVSISPTVSGRIRALDSGASIDVMNRGEVFKGMTAGYSLVCHVLEADRNRGRVDLSMMPPLKNRTDNLVPVEVDKLRDGDGFRVQLPGHGAFGHRYGRISLTDLADNFDDVRRVVERIKPGTFLECRVLPTAPPTTRVGGRDDCTAGVGDGGNEKVNLSLRPSRVSPNHGVGIADPEVRGTEDLEIGQKVRGFVKATTAKGCFISLGADIVARAQLSQLSDHFVKNIESAFPPGKLVSARVVKIDAKRGLVELSLRTDLSDATVNGVAIRDLPVGDFVSGVVKSITDYGVFVRLTDSVTGLCHKSQLSDQRLRDLHQKFSPGQRVRAKVLDVDLAKKRISLSMKPSVLADDPTPDAHMRGNSAADAPQEDLSDEEMEAQSNDSAESLELREADESEDGSDEPDEEVMEEEALDVPVGFEFDEQDHGVTSVDPEFEENATSEIEDDEEEDDDEDDEDAEKRKRKESSKEKRVKRRAKAEHEREMRRKEAALAASMDSPETAEDFERLLMGSPNSSMLWIRYIALRLSLSQVGKARETAEKALKTITYRDERERMNVWLAYLNMEASYGDETSVLHVLDRASSNVDPKQLYLRVLQAVKKDKSLAEKIVVRALNKFKSSKKIWIALGTMRFQEGDLTAARKLLERSLLSLARHKHVAVVSKFAQLEYKFGSQERGRTVFEGLIGNLPKRIDLWGIYIDMEIRALRALEEVSSEALQTTRLLLERCCALDLSTKKMKYLFKRYLEFEKEFGSSDDVQRVKDKARSYVEAKMQ